MSVAVRTQRPGAEGRAALAGLAPLLAWVGGFSVFVNLLMLTGPLFMLQVYDRVLASGSEETLAALFVLVGFLYATMGILDFARGRVLARAGARVQASLDGRVYDAVLDLSLRGAGGAALPGHRDLEAVQRLFAAPALLALFDIPWTPLFIAAIFVFHPWLGWLAVAGGGALVLLATLNQALTARPVQDSTAAAQGADRAAQHAGAEAETLDGLGMRAAARARWQGWRDAALGAAMAASDRVGLFTAATRTLRLFLQSAILALGAWLVLQGQLTAGAMIAASILLGRALAPIELALGQWPTVQAAARGWRRLGKLFDTVPPRAAPTALPAARPRLTVEGLAVVAPGGGAPLLRGVSFALGPGEALGVIGPSGAGKTALARVLAGVWPPAAGSVALDGAPLERYGPDALGRQLGYLPQRAALFEGTVAENIARLDPVPDDAAVIAAARAAGAHESILALAEGYDTRVAGADGGLSGGQAQRVGLARALYGDPALLILDEPDAHLDHEGTEALAAAIRAAKTAGRAVVVMAHRPGGIRDCDKLLVLGGGTMRAFGPRAEVLRRTVQNESALPRDPAAGRLGGGGGDGGGSGSANGHGKGGGRGPGAGGGGAAAEGEA